MTDQEQFEQRIAQHPDDDAVRLVYADWLDEHDQPEAAAQQRKVADAVKWLNHFAASAGEHCAQNYGRGHRWNNKTKKMEETGIKEIYVPVTFAMVVDAATQYVTSRGYETFTQMGSEWLRDSFYYNSATDEADNTNQKRFWECWELVTGRKRLTKDELEYELENGGNPFSCSC